MLKTLTNLLYPITCLACGGGTDWLCPDCWSKIQYNQNPLCLVCARPTVGGYTHPHCRAPDTPERLITPFSYTGPVRALVKALKYRRYYSVANYVACLMSEVLIEQGITKQFLLDAGGLVTNHVLLSSEILIVPLPLDNWRYLTRGFNQSALLAKSLAKKLKLIYTPGVLWRTSVFSPSQTTLTRERRRENVGGRFVVPTWKSRVLRNKDVILLDDVTTTGATLLEAGRILKRAGARQVWCLAVAQQLKNRK